MVPRAPPRSTARAECHRLIADAIVDRLAHGPALLGELVEAMPPTAGKATANRVERVLRQLSERGYVRVVDRVRVETGHRRARYGLVDDGSRRKGAPG